MTFLKTMVVSAGVACLISSAAFAQQQPSPPNEPRQPAPPNQPIETPSRPDMAREKRDAEQRDAEQRDAERRSQSRDENRANENRKTDPDTHSRLGVNGQRGGPMQPISN